MPIGEGFDEVAANYHRFRSGHGMLPSLLVDYVLTDAATGSPALFYEPGAGTGLATKPIADAAAIRGRDFGIVALDPGGNMLEIARHELSGYQEKVRFIQAKFGDVPDDELLPEGQRFDCIVAARAWQHLGPESTVVPRVHRLLRTAGFLVIMQNEIAVSDGKGDEFYYVSRPTWQRYVDIGKETEPLPKYAEPYVLDSKQFEMVGYSVEIERITPDLTNYLGRIGTYGPVIALSESDRRAFFGELETLINGRFKGVAPSIMARSLTLYRKCGD